MPERNNPQRRLHKTQLSLLKTVLSNECLRVHCWCDALHWDTWFFFQRYDQQLYSDLMRKLTLKTVHSLAVEARSKGPALGTPAPVFLEMVHV